MPTSKHHELLHQLSPAQCLALEAIDRGASQAAAAEAASVDRTTVARWIAAHPAFIAELNRRKADRAACTAHETLEATQLAIETVRSALSDGDVNVALKWLRLTGVYPEVTTGPTTADQAIEEHRLSMPNKGDRANEHLLGIASTADAYADLAARLASTTP